MSKLFKDIHPVDTNIYPCKNKKLTASCQFCFDATSISSSEEVGIAIFDRVSEKLVDKIPFTSEYKKGNAYCLEVSDYDNSKYCYSYYQGDLLVADKKADKYLDKNSSFGTPASRGVLKSVFSEKYNWEEDKFPNIRYEDSFIYLMHVRGFTKHNSSNTKFKGTFKGVVDKIPYLKDLGVSAIELQPAYEFNEYDIKTDKINYWGYCEGMYYAPKAAYSYSENPDTEFCDLVKELHRNGIELIMQFYFPSDYSRREIPYILEYWVEKYHVDGFHILGVDLPNRIIDESPFLANTKIMLDSLDGINFGAANYYESGINRRYALYRDDFMYSLRKFIKGDDNSISDLLYKLRSNPSQYAQINYLDNYNAFTLFDMVSYDRKHNDDNGEDNRDGNDYNFSWNCGSEGPSRKQKILNLRKKQMQNALLLLFLGSGVPMIFMGDEMCNSQRGNNNPYCHDSSVTWLDWKGLEKKDALHDYIKELAALRNNHAFLHSNKELSLVDIEGKGYPELSYHGESPWKAQIEGYRRNVGIMFCENNSLFYVAINMYWSDETLSLPRAPKGTKWKFFSSTESEIIDVIDNRVKISERTIAIFVTVKNE